MSDKPAPSAAQEGRVWQEINRLIANPPVSRRSSEMSDAESFIANDLPSRQALNSMRTKLAEDRGLTLEQWIELEQAVSHPREVIPVTVTPKMLARRRMLAAGVPELFIADVADATPIDCEPLKQVRAFLGGKDAFRVLSGGRGVRKTGSACWALGQLDNGVFVHSRHLIGLRIERKEEWERICTSKIIVLDDLGTEVGDQKGAHVASVSEMIDRVYGARNRLIITCNITHQAFRQFYGDREHDRLKEMGQWSSIAGESVRSYRGNFHPEDGDGE